MMSINKEDMIVLEHFHKDCVRFWEHTRGTTMDEDKEVAIKALEDVRRIKTNPFIPFNSPKLDPYTKEMFIKRCEMDLGL